MLCVIFRSVSTPEKGYRLNRSRDSLLRDTGFILGSTPAPGVGGGAPASTIVEAQAAYAYSATDGRIAQISNRQIPNQAFTYQYLPNSDLIEKVTGPIDTVTNSHEPNRDVLDLKQNKVGTTPISSYDYAVNAIGHRTGVATSGSAFPAVPSWLWSYDALGQVIAADSSVATSDRAYQYDAIGNRIQARDGVTTATGTPNYTANALNQYTSFPSLASVPSYDFDGNMTSGPLPVSPTTNSTLTWDAENRLTEVKNASATTLEKNLFDAGSRKIATTAHGITTLYLYDGWNCIAEYTRSVGVSPTLQKTRLWGTDLRGSMQGAGGVGGMLSEFSPITYNPITFNSSYPTYNGNGNVREYLDSTGQITAHYEYDPFGNTVVNTDTSNQFAYRFSTKPLAFATSLYYYGYRYYDPLTGRWPSRDPIEEKGGLNLHGFVGNDGVNKWDLLGQLFGFDLDYTQNLQIGGCFAFPAFPAISICITGGFTVTIDECCKDSERKQLSTVSGDVNIYIALQTPQPLSFSYTKGSVTSSQGTPPPCPDEGGDWNGSIFVGVNLGFFNQQWTYDEGQWSSATSAQLSPIAGKVVYGGGTLSILKRTLN